MIRNGLKAEGQLLRDRSVGGALFLLSRGRGTDGGFVVDRSAAKYRHNAGPTP